MPSIHRNWINSQLKTKRVHSVCTTLTPALAAELLELNENNRKLSSWQVSRYAKDIAAGNWVLNGEPIIISDTGYLNDGQHRCAGVIEANTPIQTLIVFGVPRESRSTVDIGLKRTAGAHMAMRGWHNGNDIAYAATLLIGYERSGGLTFNAPGYDKRPSVSEIIEWAENNPDIASSVTKSLPFKALRCSIGLVAALHWLLAKKDLSESDVFFGLLLTGDGLRSNDNTSAILLLRNRLISMRPARIRDGNSSTGTTRISTEALAALFIKAWNSWRSRKVAYSLKWGSAENFPVPE